MLWVEGEISSYESQRIRLSGGSRAIKTWVPNQFFVRKDLIKTVQGCTGTEG